MPYKTFFKVFALTCVSALYACGGGGDNSTQGDPTAPHLNVAKVYQVTLGGDDQGEGRLHIDENGNAELQFQSEKSHRFSRLSGLVKADGAVRLSCSSLESSAVSTGADCARFEGTVAGDGRITGTWTHPRTEESGSWSSASAPTIPLSWRGVRTVTLGGDDQGEGHLQIDDYGNAVLRLQSEVSHRFIRVEGLVKADGTLRLSCSSLESSAISAGADCARFEGTVAGDGRMAGTWTHPRTEESGSWSSASMPTIPLTWRGVRTVTLGGNDQGEGRLDIDENGNAVLRLQSEVSHRFIRVAGLVKSDGTLRLSCSSFESSAISAGADCARFEGAVAADGRITGTWTHHRTEESGTWSSAPTPTTPLHWRGVQAVTLGGADQGEGRLQIDEYGNAVLQLQSEVSHRFIRVEGLVKADGTLRLSCSSFESSAISAGADCARFEGAVAGDGRIAGTWTHHRTGESGTWSSAPLPTTPLNWRGVRKVSLGGDDQGEGRIHIDENGNAVLQLQSEVSHRFIRVAGLVKSDGTLRLSCSSFESSAISAGADCARFEGAVAADGHIAGTWTHHRTEESGSWVTFR